MKVKIQKTKNRFSSILGAVSVLVVVCSLVFSFVGPVTAYAEWGEPLNYQDLDYTVKLGSDYNTVTVPLPDSNCYFKTKDSDDLLTELYGSSSFSISGLVDKNYRLRVFPVSPFGLDISNIPDGSTVRFDIEITDNEYDYNSSSVDYHFPSLQLMGYYIVFENGDYAWKEHTIVADIDTVPLSGKYFCEFTIHHEIDNCIGFVPCVQFSDFIPKIDREFRIEVVSSVLTMNISSDYWQQWQNEQNGEMLNTINDKIDSAINGTPEQNDKVNSAVDEMNQASDKLGALGDSMSSVEKPLADNIKTDISNFVDPVSWNVLTAPFHKLWENDTLLAMISVVVTLVIVSWVFFGKKK